MTKEAMDSIREKLMQAYSADLYDVLDKMGYPNQCLDLSISPLNPDWKAAGLSSPDSQPETFANLADREFYRRFKEYTLL